MREAVKSFNKLVAAKQLKEAQKLIPSLYQAIDKATKRGVIKGNAAARKKSRLLASLKKSA